MNPVEDGRPVPCEHWRAADLPGGGRCLIGRQGGWPNLAACFACLSRDGKPIGLSMADAAAQLRAEHELARTAGGRGCCGR
jgi:hypothetical protein